MAMTAPNTAADRPGTLWVVATPIGNLNDLSSRAVETLRQAAWIACEDTRSSRPLLERIGCQAQLIPSHEHNEEGAAARIADLVASGAQVAVISDAGTPAISDPGFRAVRECRRRNLPVCPIPGPCSPIVALSASGLPSDRFLFTGFLPPKSAARTRFLEENKDAQHTLVVLESVHRINKFLDEIVEVLGSDRIVCVARELTKLHETMHVGRAAAVRDAVARGSQKGEFVVLVAKDGFEL